MNAMISILSYILILIAMYYSTKTQAITINDNYDYSKNHKRRLLWVLFFSLVFGLYNKYIIGIKTVLSGDRLNYFQDFNGRLTGYIIFDEYLKFIRRFTNDFSNVLLITTIISCLCCFLSLNISKYFNRNALVFFLVSRFIIDSFVDLKQTLAGACSSLFFVLCIEYKSKIAFAVEILLIILSAGLHSTGYILIPLFIVLKVNMEKLKHPRIIYFLIFIMLLFFEPILLFIADFTRNIFPLLSEKIITYASDSSIHDNDGGSLILAALKGFPFYILVIIGIYNNKKGRRKYKNYDKYLILTSIGAMMSLATLFSYWYARFSIFFMVPMSIFFSMIINIIDKKNKLIIEGFIIGSLSFFTFRSMLLTYIYYGGY